MSFKFVRLLIGNLLEPVKLPILCGLESPIFVECNITISEELPDQTLAYLYCREVLAPSLLGMVEPDVLQAAHCNRIDLTEFPNDPQPGLNHHQLTWGDESLFGSILRSLRTSATFPVTTCTPENLSLGELLHDLLLIREI
jgi:hypothetical protein